MKEPLLWYYKHIGLIYKLFLFLVATVSITYFFPQKGIFKYEFQKGKPWLHQDLIAPFDFAVKKLPETLKRERAEIVRNKSYYFDYRQDVADRQIADLQQKVEAWNADSLHLTIGKPLLTRGKALLEHLYKSGILQLDPLLSDLDTAKTAYLIDSDKLATPVARARFFTLRQASNYLTDSLAQWSDKGVSAFKSLLINHLEPNVFFDAGFTQKSLNQQLKGVATAQGVVQKNARIISKGDIVQGDNYRELRSLKAEYENRLYSENAYYKIVAGYFILVGITLFMLLLYLYYYEPDIYAHNSQVTFIIFNIVLMVVTAALVKPLTGNFIYLIPFCILPIVIRAFFDPRTALFTHMIAVLMAGFVAPNSFEFIYLQFTAGVVTILTTTSIFKRQDLFFAVFRVILVYSIAYFGLAIVQEGSFREIDYFNFAFFAGNGLLTLLAQPLIYLYERVFGLVSNLSLLELSDSNSPLLRQLNQKAPGTMQHSLQVANLAEQAAMEVGANPLLARIGALYHDVGKMNNPTYFIENQNSIVNPHENCSPKQSARIIIQHVIDGIELARKSDIPDRVIDFIRTHHGTSPVYYFLEKYKEENPDLQVDEADFRYPGPIPFSKETAIVMMSDAIEAASRALERPDASKLSELVDRVVERQLSQAQFLNAEITMKEIQRVKKVLKKKLMNIYHVRVPYPEQDFDKKSL